MVNYYNETWKSPSGNKRIPTIELFDSKKFNPGIQNFYPQWKNLTVYLVNILNWARKTVPENRHSDTPIYLMATAGVRTLSIEEASTLFDHIKQDLASGPFAFHPEWASVLSGEEEGVYSWIAANYLLGFFDSYNPVNKSVGLLEMGGASMQITFIPRDPLYAEEFQVHSVVDSTSYVYLDYVIPFIFPTTSFLKQQNFSIGIGDHVYGLLASTNVTIAGTRYQLYAQSYMKYGANAIKERLADVIARQTGGGTDLDNPCMLTGDKTNIKLESGSTYSLKGTGSATECNVLLEQILQPNQGYGCQPKPCAIGSVHQPSVADIQFYATQAFTFTPKALKVLANDSILRLDSLEQAAKKHCSLNITEVKNPKFASDDCLMGLYIPTLFIKSYGFSNTTTNIKVTNNIGSQTIDWALGVMLMELSSRFTYNSSKENYAVTCPSDGAIRKQFFFLISGLMLNKLSEVISF
ncbi:hypothetical protein Btru_005409 [Bulinus truncatus]|nr:hypothetical protein Btru_005409 [Bulinus truncatus]